MCVDIVHDLETQDFRIGYVGIARLRMAKITYQINKDQMKNIRQYRLGIALLSGKEFRNGKLDQVGNFLVLKPSLLGIPIIQSNRFQRLGQFLVRGIEREKVGDILVVGNTYGKIRTMTDEKGKPVQEFLISANEAVMNFISKPKRKCARFGVNSFPRGIKILFITLSNLVNL